MKLKIVIGNTSQWPGSTISLPLLLHSRWSISTYTYISSIRPRRQDSPSPAANTGPNWCEDSLVAGEVFGMSSFVWLTVYEKCSPDRYRYNDRQGQGCVLWDPINAHSMRVAIYTLSREPTNTYETETDFEVDDRRRCKKIIVLWSQTRTLKACESLDLRD